MAAEPTADARALLLELIEAANRRDIIPARLPGQLEAILEAMKAEPPTPVAPAATGDIGAILKEQADVISHAIHDLRLPLTSIKGYSDMMGNMGPLNDMQQQFLTTIRTNTKRLESLLMDVSDIMKIRGRTLHIAPKMDMVKNILGTVEKRTRPLAEELKRTLTFDIPTGLPILNVDGEVLSKALIKLVENALRYIAAEAGEVIVSVVGEGDNLRVTIRDNGIGMSPEELAKLGTIYYRGDNEVVLAFKGSGLGIPVAYGIIDLLGGRVQVESQPGQGSTFTVELQGVS
ncbi:MAG: HAMP domain-containing histidine kinase [Anaerolineae bacterium]|nr:HAMP domain-containing histidine kinase [Anaerolineae bacterium]